VDRVLLRIRSRDQIAMTAAEGGITMQRRHIFFEDYELLMDRREGGGYDVYHWYPGQRSRYLISPNLNLHIDPNKPETKLKHELLNDKRFRQALSLAINRAAVINAEYNGMAEPSQACPGPQSPFYEPSLYDSYVKYDPAEANRLLDEIGLTERDYEGYRTFKNGTRMTFFLNYCDWVQVGLGQFVVDDWAKVGIRLILRQKSRTLFWTELVARKHDFSIWDGGEYFAPLEPSIFTGSNYALAYQRWYNKGGLYGDPAADRVPGAMEPSEGHPLRDSMNLCDLAVTKSKPEELRETFRKVLKIAAENVWTINVSTEPPTLVVVKNGFKNVPRQAVASGSFQTPGNTGIETFYFENPHDSPGAIEQIKHDIVNITPPPDTPAAVKAKEAGSKFGALLRWFFISIGILLVLLTAVRHPYIGRRLLIMIPTLLIISVIVFTVIQLPPGDYVTSRIMQLEQSGDEVDLQRMQEIREMFRVDDPAIERYARWLGLAWFTTFDEKDQGLLQGYMGRSMNTLESVNEMVGDRILLTFLISLGTILFTWAIAVPIGIYSAVRQYSVGDYVFTFIGFVGMCVPSFLLALLLTYAANEWFDVSAFGLFSSQYATQPEWTWGKFVDLLKHIWVPVVVLGVGGTAGMIRVMRGNLLDELRKPYVTTARAKGVRPTKLLMKYPVRLALNPFISGIGGIFPTLVSGGAIVAMVLGLTTVGPLMLDALMTEDMYLAGSMLMVLSLLGIFGTLVSDLLLLWLDPRIRFKRGAR
ncbi:MAG: ABC transporter substrate-binding protein, partial [Planctomycetota bacterium]|nr:ABC transporter substrate-binding protein [Planctomycetota bacterium]